MLLGLNMDVCVALDRVQSPFWHSNENLLKKHCYKVYPNDGTDYDFWSSHICDLLNTMNFDIQKQIGCSCTIPAILSVNHSCLRCVNAIYCLINFISINMHRIHFPFVLLNCKICCCFSFPFRKVRNCAQQICCIPLEIASTSTRRQGKLFYKLLLLFTFCFFDVYSSTGKAMQRTQG